METTGNTETNLPGPYFSGVQENRTCQVRQVISYKLTVLRGLLKVYIPFAKIFPSALAETFESRSWFL